MDNLYNLQFSDDLPFGAIMKVIGIGGAGCNAVNRMVSSRLEGVETIVMNTDVQSLNMSSANQTYQIGRTILRGRGAGADPTIGLKAAEQDEAMIAGILKGTDLVFITAGMGGGTGTGAAPKVAEIAHRLDALTVAVVTLPFTFEGRQRMKVALEGVERLRQYVDTLVVIPNESLLGIIDDNTPFREAFKIADMVLAQATRGISDLIAKTGEPNLDFSDVRTVMHKGGDALIGLGVAAGKDRASLAARQALKCPLLQNLSISGASQVLVNITGAANMTMREVSEAMNLIYHEAGENANVIFGAVIDEDLDAETAKNMNITVIATGLSSNQIIFDKTAYAAKATPIMQSVMPTVEQPIVQPVIHPTPAPAPVHQMAAPVTATPVYQERLREEPARPTPRYGYDEPSIAANESAAPSRSWSQGEERSHGNGNGNGNGSGNGNGNGRSNGNGNGSGNGNSNGNGGYSSPTGASFTNSYNTVKREELRREEVEVKHIHLGEIDLDAEPPRALGLPPFLRGKTTTFR